MQNELLTNTMVAATVELVKLSVTGIIDTWLKPKLEVFNNRKDINDKLEDIIFNVFSEYLKRTYEQHKYINMLALGNQQINLINIYQPLTIRLTNINSKSEEKYLMSKYDTELAKKYKKIIIEDTAGMGKSTLMKMMFLSSIETNAGIPIFIELRKLSPSNTIIDEILNTINYSEEDNSKEFINELIKRGDFIFFLDGFDEIPFDIKEEIIKYLKSFISRANKNTFFLTSRSDDSLISFGDFQKFEIDRLKHSEAYELIEKYDQILQLDLAKMLKNQLETSLQDNKFRDLDSFLGIPLLVSLLYVTYKHKRDIPVKKDHFYRKVYDALFEEHDLSKDGFKRKKHSDLSSDKLHKVLSNLAFLCLVENKIEYNKDKLLNLISKSLDSPYLNNISPSDVLKDILYSVPLLIQDGLQFKWAHKSFMEYFAAISLYNNNDKEKILKKILESEKFHVYTNFLDLYYDIDQETFERILIYPILKDFLFYMEKDNNSHNDILILKQLLYNRGYYYSSKKINRDISEIETIIEKDLIKKYSDKGYEFNILTVIITGDGKLSSVLTRNYKFEKILNILFIKRSFFVNVYKRKSKKSLYRLKKGRILTYIDINSIDNYRNNLEFIGMFNLRLEKIIYLDYRKSKDYVQLLESYMTKSNIDIYDQI